MTERNLDKKKLEPVLKQNGFTQTTANTWATFIDNKRYLVDFKNKHICRTQGENLTERIHEDPDDKTLNAIIKMCVDVMGGEQSSSEAPEADQSTEAEKEESTEPEYEYPPQEPYVPALAPKKQLTYVTTNYTRDQINTIRNTVAKGADDNELAMFLHIANTYGLDPFLKEIFYSEQMKTIITSRDGYLKVAQRDPDFEGIQSMAVCKNDDFSVDMVNNVVNHSFGKGERGDVIGAWAVCYRKGRKPVIAYADYAEYNRGNQIWKTYKSAMCCKVAEAFALKRQFGISGLVTQEEMGVEA
jgi:phage recombination protein Bet